MPFKSLHEFDKNVKNVNVKDEDHIWYKGKQYISLRRFYERLQELLDEIKQLTERNEKLQEENDILTKLLFRQAANQDTPNTTTE
jgi:cell shape-determining protein MreC